MGEQRGQADLWGDTAPHNPADHGLYPHIVDDQGAIVRDKWMTAYLARKPVGTCRLCGSLLAPREPYRAHGATQYEASCTNVRRSVRDAGTGGRAMVGCGWEGVALGGRAAPGVGKSGKK